MPGTDDDTEEPDTTGADENDPTINWADAYDPTNAWPDDASELFSLVEITAPQRVVIKTVPRAFDQYEDELERWDAAIEQVWYQLRESYFDVTIRRAFRGLTGGEDVLPEMYTYYEILLPPGREEAIAFGERAIELLTPLDKIELVYIESPPAPQPDSCDGWDRVYLQTPAGLNIDPAQGDDDAPWLRVVDLERVSPNHPALAHVAVMPGFSGPPDRATMGDLDGDAGSDDFAISRDHTTACLGILGANGGACPGLLPKSAGLTFATSLTTDNPTDSIVEAIASQIERVSARMNWGEILLIEQQVWAGTEDTCGSGERPNRDNAILAPVELEPLIHTAIRNAVRKYNIIVIEPAGNGGKDSGVDLVNLRTWDRCLGIPVQSTGAIITGAAIVEPPQDNGGRATVAPVSNFGARVACFASGQGVVTLDTAPHGTTRLFGQTSAASALMAGLVARLQSEAMRSSGIFLPQAMRSILLRRANGAIVTTRATGLGVMPDLQKAIASLP